MQKIRTLALTVSCCAVLAGVAAGPALGAVSVTTLPASGVTPTQATLNGTINTGGVGVAWAFQFGTSANYNKATPIQFIPAGNSSNIQVAWTINRLTPHTTYHFRLVVARGAGTYYYPFNVITGSDLTFTTQATGSLILRSRTLSVRGRFVYSRLECRSQLDCQGRYSITTRARVAHTRRFAQVTCATTEFRIRAGRTITSRARVSRACRALLRRARHHRIKARFSSRPRTGQQGILTGVTLVRL